jgi:hypothetical protein
MFVETIANALKVDLKDVTKRKWSLIYPLTNSAGQTMTDLTSSSQQIVSVSKKELSMQDLMSLDSCTEIFTSSGDMNQHYLSSKSAVQKHMPEFATISWKNDEADSLNMTTSTSNKGSDLVVSCMAQSILFDSCANIVLTDMIVSYFKRSYDGNTKNTCEKIGKLLIYICFRTELFNNVIVLFSFIR